MQIPTLKLSLLSLLTLPLPATDYWVSAIYGADTNVGTNIGLPFKTLTKALSGAASGDRIFVLPGRYTPTLGESFPLQVGNNIQVIGTDPRSCLIDAEFDPTKGSANTVQGTMVQLSPNAQLVRMGVVNGPRDPSNPGNYWWARAVIANNAGADNIRIANCVVDRVSRGIFVGTPSGSANFQGVSIESTVVSRFYVEGINATSNGTSSNNRVINCTVVGHMNPTSNKPYGRACMSFGNGTQFDVINTICVRADWAGIEATNTATITSDYNCIHGVGAAYRGVTGGTNDLLTDPGLADMPDSTTPADVHHQGPSGVLWDKGTNLLTTGNDIDYQSARLWASKVDIGADEYSGTDLWFRSSLIPGENAYIGAVGSAANTMLVALTVSTLQTPISIPGISGKLEIDLTQPHIILGLPLDSRGLGSLRIPLPKVSGVAGSQVVIQGVDSASATFTDHDKLLVVE